MRSHKNRRKQHVLLFFGGDFSLDDDTKPSIKKKHGETRQTTYQRKASLELDFQVYILKAEVKPV